MYLEFRTSGTIWVRREYMLSSPVRASQSFSREECAVTKFENASKNKMVLLWTELGMELCGRSIAGGD